MSSGNRVPATSSPASGPVTMTPGVWRCIAVFAAIIAGCGRATQDGSAPPAAEMRESIAAQVAAVREGRSSRIVAPAALADADWESLRGLTGLTELVLEQGRADDDRAEILATLAGLERLVLRESPLTDVGFARLAMCRSLRDLNVPQAACTAAGIESLAQIDHLKSLRVGGPFLQGPQVGAAIARLSSLRSLHLIDVPIGDDGLAALQQLPGLWNLYLDGAGVSDDAWAVYFRACPNVHVHVDQSHHDRDPRRHE